MSTWFCISWSFFRKTKSKNSTLLLLLFMLLLSLRRWPIFRITWDRFHNGSSDFRLILSFPSSKVVIHNSYWDERKKERKTDNTKGNEMARLNRRRKKSHGYKKFSWVLNLKMILIRNDLAESSENITHILHFFSLLILEMNSTSFVSYIFFTWSYIDGSKWENLTSWVVSLSRCTLMIHLISVLFLLRWWYN